MRVDYLIIGQGVSGTFLSYYLMKEGKECLVIDDDNKDAPSKVAAGIINPVTGRRMVTVWMAEEVIPFAKGAYEEFGSELGITAISQKNIIDFFPNPFMRENFIKRVEEGNEYIGEPADTHQYRQWFNFEFGCGEIKPVYTAHLEILLPAWRQRLTQDGRLLNSIFEPDLLELPANGIRYRDIEASAIIFCDGSPGADHPWFRPLPFAPNKGEALIVHIPGLPSDHLFKKSLVLAPLPGRGADIFWIGSNYAWDFPDPNPTEAFRTTTEKSLLEWLKLPFTILDHRASVRPATLERRPFVGIHPRHRQIGILNGMGTKGCSLAPFFARQFADHLVSGAAITAEADVKRFSRILGR